ncbi:MAG: PEGA domain-containing protein [Fibromonadaceae bacterium]|jgi:hypothetical protein|nr:PEGA domain-containing protein [Fibromonadaceae bacterium]
MSISKISSFLPILFLAFAVYSQEGIKFQIPTDESGAPAPAAVPAKQEPQKLGVATGRPLNLAELTAKDTAGFETYSKRHALVQDSMSAIYRQIESIKANSRSFMPKLEPKSEFEKQAEFDSRQSKWNSELAQRVERDTKSLSLRLSELEKAKTKILENQASLYGSLEIKSIPSSASIYVGKDEIGATPAEYSLLIPGEAKISVRKEGYDQWDTVLQVASGAKFKLNVALEEKSIFSKENEINFSKLLSKDTTVLGYSARIERVKARKVEIDGEIRQLLEGFSNSYPPLEPQRQGESPESFANRHKAWTNEGMRQYGELQRKHKAYSDRLARSAETLSDYIIATQSTMIAEAAVSAKTELGAYDAEKETFELLAQDSSSSKSPFYFRGRVGVPVAVAKELNRAAPGFAIGLQYINYPFQLDSGSVNLAMSKLQLSLNGKQLDVQGSFGEIKRYAPMEGYNEWKAHADSLLSGKLKPRGLDYAYAMGKNAAKDAAKKEESSEPGEGLDWRGWTGIIAFTAAAACGTMAVVKHFDAKKYKDDINDINKTRPTTKDEYSLWYLANYNGLAKDVKGIKDNESSRNNFGIGAGVFAIAGALTFVF